MFLGRGGRNSATWSTSLQKEVPGKEAGESLHGGSSAFSSETPPAWRLGPLGLGPLPHSPQPSANDPSPQVVRGLDRLSSRFQFIVELGFPDQIHT